MTWPGTTVSPDCHAVSLLSSHSAQSPTSADRAIGFGREIIGSPSGHKKGATMGWLFFLRPPRLYDMVENDRQFYFQTVAHPRPPEYESNPGPARERATTSRARG